MVSVYFSKTCRKNSSFMKIRQETGTLHDDLCTFLIVTRSVLRLRNFSDKSYRENHFMYNNFFLPGNSAVYEMWKNMVQPDRPQMTKRRMSFACWITKTKNTHSLYVILIAFPLQQWLNKRPSMLRLLYTFCLVNKYLYCVIFNDRSQIKMFTA